MLILKPNKYINSFFELARQEALKSSCKRAKCGSVIIQSNRNLIGSGYNSPPRNDPANARCERKHEIKSGFKSDKTCCVHAEQRAIMDMLGSDSFGFKTSTLYYVRLDENNGIKVSGKPYCTICSKMALDAGIDYFVLIQDQGIAKYSTKEYNDLSFEYNG